MKWAFMEDTRNQFKAIVCDGAVRSGKTVCMVTAFLLWAQRYFDGQNFGICGKTVASAERNIIQPAQDSDDLRAFFKLAYRKSDHVLVVKGNGHENRFYVFGGKDEGSAALIQGITLAGVFLDEVALMPRSFVEQALARCSVEGSRFWFNCNPDAPSHWFYQEWILCAEEKNALHLHFLMEDNPSLSPEVLERYYSLYSGVFYDRYIRDDFEKQYVPRQFEEICRQYLIRQNRAGKLPIAFDRIGKYYYDDPQTRTNGEFDIVTEDPNGYVFYEAKFRSEPLTQSMIQQEIEQVRRTGMNCYRYAFISRSGFDAQADEGVELILLEKLYE